MQYYLDPFGCAKNQVDAENIMALLNRNGWTASGPETADLIIINSCGFIESAKQESINAVLAWRKMYPEKKILLTGCLAQRYKNELKESLPEADNLFGNDDLNCVVEAAGETVNSGNSTGNKKPAAFALPAAPALQVFSPGERPLLSLLGSAYVKISEGCDNHCSFCAIPLIRGNLKSREMPEILDECRILLERGIKELCIIGQDICSYGRDNKDINLESYIKPGLPELMQKISGIKGEFWVRLLYMHPDNFLPAIPEIMKEDPRFLPYFDLPFQHGSQRILGLMNRRGNMDKYLALINNIRRIFPDAVIRSTFMTGFPGETENDFRELLDFQKKACLDWAGVFAYSREEDTPAYSMKHRPAKKLALERKRILEEQQISITEKQMDRFVGRSFDVLVEEKVEGEDGLWLGRLPFQAPEIEGSAVISSDKVLVLGTFTEGRIFARAGMDLEVRV